MSEIADIQDALSKELIIRDMNFPIREESNTTQAKLLENHFIEEVLKIPVHSNSNNIHKEIQNNPIFVGGNMKSGTTMLIELLDGHSGLNVLPGDSRYYTDYRKRFSNEEVDDLAIKFCKRLINPKGQAPFWLLGQNPENYASFISKYKTIFLSLKNDHKRAFLSYMIGFLEMKDHKSAKYWVEKTPENEINFDALKMDYPNAKFIHVLRNPSNNISSLKKLYEFRNWNWDINAQIDKISRSIENVLKFSNNEVFTVRYEDLVQCSEQTLRSICQFLHIKWEGSLLVPTINGINTKANSMNKESVRAGKILNNTQSLSNLSKLEKNKIVSALYPKVNHYGYYSRMEYLKSKLNL